MDSVLMKLCTINFVEAGILQVRIIPARIIRVTSWQSEVKYLMLRIY